MRECSICKELKTIDNFHRRGNGHRTECKSCKSIIDSKRKRDRDPFFSVYYIPEHHYVGMTNSIKYRMQEHKTKGKIVDGYEVIGTYERAVDAHLVETTLHTMGYFGFYYKGSKKK
jgi:hypothetical protein